MDAVPFEFPILAIPFVVMSGEVAGASAPLRVLFDTGNASPFMVIVAEHSPAAAQARRTGRPPVVLRGVAGGGPAEITPARLKSFRLGPITLRNVSAGISPGVDIVAARLPGGLDAAVGQTFAKGRIVTVDYAARRIDFAGHPGPPGSAVAMTMTPKRPLSVIDVKINGRGPYRLALDTGASGTLISPETARSAGVGEAGRTLNFGGVGGTGSVGRLESARLDVGANSFPGANVVVADLFQRVSEEAGARIDGVLGAPILARGRLTIDYPAGKVWIEAPSDGPKP
jgi:hypothetical protein